MRSLPPRTIPGSLWGLRPCPYRGESRNSAPAVPEHAADVRGLQRDHLPALLLRLAPQGPRHLGHQHPPLQAARLHRGGAARGTPANPRNSGAGPDPAASDSRRRRVSGPTGSPRFPGFALGSSLTSHLGLGHVPESPGMCPDVPGVIPEIPGLIPGLPLGGCTCPTSPHPGEVSGGIWEAQPLLSRIIWESPKTNPPLPLPPERSRGAPHPSDPLAFPGSPRAPLCARRRSRPTRSRNSRRTR